MPIKFDINYDSSERNIIAKSSFYHLQKRGKTLPDRDEEGKDLHPNCKFAKTPVLH